MKPKCLLISPTKYFYKDIPPEPVKYHLLTLMSHLTDLAEVEIVDLEMRFGFPQSAEEIDAFLARSEEVLEGRAPDVIGVSSYTSYDYLASVDVLRLCHRLYPEAVKVVGGYHPTAVPEDYLGGDVPVDYIVRGEGEVVMRRLLSGGPLAAGPVLDGPPLDLAEEQPLRYDLYPYRSEEVTLALSRGCPFHCSFCVQSDDFPNHYRRLSLDRIRDKIERLRAHLPVRRIVFIDPFFGVQRKHTLELVDLLTRRFPDLHYWAETRIDTVRPEWLEKIAQLKLDLHFGVESLAPGTLRLMQKAKNPERYIDSFHRTLEMCQQARVLARCGFIMNYPGESPESYRTTLAHLRRAVDRYDEVQFTFHCNQYALYPGNGIYHRRHEIARERGFSFPNDGWWRRREPKVRKRSEQCLASRPIAEELGGDPGFWKDDVLELLKRYSSKYSYQAFSFYRRDEMLESLRSHYPERRISGWDEETWGEPLELLRRYRYLLRDLYFRYEDWLRRCRPEVEELFFRLFNLVTYRRQQGLLASYDAGTSAVTLLADIETLGRRLRRELENNVQANAHTNGDGAQRDLELSLLGDVYRFTGGQVLQLEVSLERKVS